MPHKFDPKKLHCLDSEKRKKLFPVEPILENVSLSDGDAVADIGCGTGYLLFSIKALLQKGVRYYAIDISQEALDIVRERAGDSWDVVTVLSQENFIPLPDSSISLALMGALYHELENRPKFLQEIKRLLKPSGTLVVLDYSPTGQDEESGPPNEDRIPLDVVLKELESASFHDTKCLYVLEQTYAVIARKQE
mgnify:CR=1 FL=1